VAHVGHLPMAEVVRAAPLLMAAVEPVVRPRMAAVVVANL